MSIIIGEIKDGFVFKDWSGEGYIYKNEDAFNSGKGVCYVPEEGEVGRVALESASLFYYEDFLKLAGGNKEIAQHIFYTVTWEHPESYAASLPDIDIIMCERCGYVFDLETESKCPRCNQLKQSFTNKRDRDLSAVVYEWCPECEYEVELENKFAVQICPQCGKEILPCSLCFDCVNPCPLQTKK